MDDSVTSNPAEGLEAGMKGLQSKLQKLDVFVEAGFENPASKDYAYFTLGGSERVEWHCTDVHQIEFLHSLFHEDWNFIGQYTRHTPKEAFLFWKLCKCGISDDDHRYFQDEPREEMSGDAITTYWEDARQKILLSDNDIKLLNSIQKALSHVIYPYSTRVRLAVLAFITIWILGCDFLILVYGIRFDLKDMFEYTKDIVKALATAEKLCKANPYEAMNWFDKVGYDEQTTRIENSDPSKNTFLGIFFNADGSLRWLLANVTSLLVSWFLWSPLGMVGKVIYNLWYWEPFQNRTPDELYDEAVEEDSKIVSVDVNDLIFQPHVILIAQKRLNYDHRKATGVDITMSDMEESLAWDHSFLGMMVSYAASAVGCCIAACCEDQKKSRTKP